MKYSHKIEEIENGELKLISNEAGTIDSIIITKEMIPWIINTLRGACFEDYNSEKTKWREKINDCTVLIGTDFFVERTPYSYIEVYIYWGSNNPKNSAPIIIPYNRQFKELTMSEFIEPFLCDLEKYLTKEEQEKLLKPWSINQTREQVVEKWQKTHTSDPNEIKINFSFNSSEKIALLKETLPPAEKIKPKTSFIRVQTGQRKTFAQQAKTFAWVTDPYILAGNDLPNDFLRSVGFPENSMKTSTNDKIWLDLVVFKDVDTAKKFIPDEVIDWKRITKELEDGINNANIDQINDLRTTIPDLITKDNTFNRKLFEEKYLDYFMNQHVPGTKYKIEFEDLGNIIYDYTGASDLFTGSGVTASANGIENIERGFNNYKGFDISEMRDYRNIKIFRFEVINDASKKIKRVYVKELNQ